MPTAAKASDKKGTREKEVKYPTPTLLWSGCGLVVLGTLFVPLCTVLGRVLQSYGMSVPLISGGLPSFLATLMFIASLYQLDRYVDRLGRYREPREVSPSDSCWWCGYSSVGLPPFEGLSPFTQCPECGDINLSRQVELIAKLPVTEDQTRAEGALDRAKARCVKIMRSLNNVRAAMVFAFVGFVLARSIGFVTPLFGSILAFDPIFQGWLPLAAAPLAIFGWYFWTQERERLREFRQVKLHDAVRMAHAERLKENSVNATPSAPPEQCAVA